MLALKKIKEEKETVKTIKDLLQIYQEIATLKMKQIRERVLMSRRFFREILEVYKEVKSAYWPKKEKKKKPEVLVFLSADEFLYGNLILNIWEKLSATLEKNNSDLVIVGKVGQYFFQKSNFKNKTFLFEEKDFSQIVNFLKNYERILVFFGKYEGGLIQRPMMEEIVTRPKTEKETLKREYEFEPSVEKVLDFFEEEMVAVLFNITLLEHQLARYAARMIALSEAVEKAKKLEEKLQKKEIKIKRELLTKSQIERFNSQIK